MGRKGAKKGEEAEQKQSEDASRDRDSERGRAMGQRSLFVCLSAALTVPTVCMFPNSPLRIAAMQRRRTEQHDESAEE